MVSAEGANQSGIAIATRLAGFVVGAEQRLPATIEDAAMAQILDWIGCAAAAASAGRAEPAVALAGARVPAWIAALGGSDALSDLLAFGSLGHALDFDSTHSASMSHLSACVAPTVLWAGGRLHARGPDVLRAYAIGVECGARIGTAASGALHKAGYHATAVTGIFATVAAMGALVEATEATVRNAFGIAGSLAAGILEYHRAPSDTKILHPGFAAANGVRALQLAELGARGPETVFEGRFGVYATLAGVEANLAAFDGLGASWHFLDTAYKLYPNCAMLHPAVDAVLQAREGSGGRHPTSISVSIPAQCVDLIAEPRPKKLAPSSGHDAKFSLQYGVAYAWRNGELTPEAFTEKSIASRDLLELAEIVSYEAEPMAGYPADFGSRVVVRLEDGTELVAVVESPRGSTSNPIDEQQIVQKFRDLAGDAFGSEQTDRLAQLVMGLGETKDIAGLCETLFSKLGIGAPSLR